MADGAKKNLAAVLGTGQTKYVAKRKDVSMNGLVREAIDKALADSDCTMDDIDAVVVGKAPDFFEGVMMPELFMADATGATNKPLIRVHTAGSVGGSTAIVAASLVQSGKYRRVLTMAWEKQSESNAMWALSIPVPFTKPVGAGAGGYFAPHIRAYIRRSGAPTHIGAMVAVKDRLNGAKNPLAHLHQPDITLEKVLESPMLWDPIRYDETCPSSDGAAALVIGDEATADARVAEEVHVPGQQGVDVGAVDVANLRRGGREGDLGAGGSSRSAPFAPHASTRGRRRQLYGVRAVRGQPLALRHPRRVQRVVELHHLHQVRVPRGFVPRALAVSHEEQSFFARRQRAEVDARRVRDSGARVRHPAQGDDSRDAAVCVGASAALQAPVQRQLRRSVLRDGAEGALRSSHASLAR